MSLGLAPPAWDGVSRVLAVRPDNVGDVVMLGPALRALRRTLPRARITLLASPAGAEAAALLPWIDEVLATTVVWQDASGAMPHDPRRELDLVSRLADGRFDAAFLFTSFSQSPWPPAYACYLAGIPVRIGQSKEFGGSLLTHAVPPAPDAAHQVDRNLHLVEAAGVAPAGRHLEVEVPPAAEERGDALLREVGILPGQPFVALAPGASCSARRWFPDRFAAVATSLAGEDGLPVLVVGSARDAGAAAPVEAAGAGRGVVSLVGRTSVAELASVLARAALLVANDSGPMHLADALDRPTVVLYSGTELESQWRPRRAPTRLLRRPTPCSPCHLFECPYGLPCLDIPAEEAVAHARELLSPTPLAASARGGLESACAPSAS